MKSIKRAIVCVFAILFILGVTTPLIYAQSQSEPILIQSDTDISTFGFDGKGTITEPWIIESKVISANGGSYCIRISNTKSHIVIRNCEFDGIEMPTSEISSAVYLDNVENVTVENNKFNDIRGIGIYLNTSKNVKLIENTLGDSYFGIESRKCNNIHIESNVMNGCIIGISLWRVNGIIYKNILNNCSNGLGIAFSNNVDINDNRIIFSSGTGMGLNNCGQLTITNNSYENCSTGLSLNPSCNNIVVFNNEFINNKLGVANSIDTNNNTFYQNNFIDNNIQAFDQGNNIWYNTSLKSGNYWNDHVGTSAYPIPGGSNVDRYPSAEPFPIYSEESPDNWAFTRTNIIVAVAIFVIALSVFYIGRKIRKKNAQMHDSDRNATTEEEPHDN
ncbi:MAG: right-handed parallel beta-helix repeat-containing protein [Candidatus Thermoplasmatota archaeon]|nr:hypothetical protein [Euryarchaeota archaeon]MBU4072282.1 right-handed parallel beta-helix repeat-containing protein [Candidatus Thermoplasmatota archaeon]MBU4145212.1 right-handed parallel beta-helix repeat-containing protein [Candidatus Thermoplasmatota archaeon]MBU4591048.1 right-handed parallel beta-helix repeat-containing protein [Candidatus Thermoplasmatota archaeon]